MKKVWKFFPRSRRWWGRCPLCCPPSPPRRPPSTASLRGRPSPSTPRRLRIRDPLHSLILRRSTNCQTWWTTIYRTCPRCFFVAALFVTSPIVHFKQSVLCVKIPELLLKIYNLRKTILWSWVDISNQGSRSCQGQKCLESHNSCCQKREVTEPCDWPKLLHYSR